MPRKQFHLAIEPDPCLELPVEEGPGGKGVGRWVPDEKHALMAKMLRGTRHARAKFPHRIFVDPFCGPGRIRVRGEEHSRDGGAVVAWRQSVGCGAPFTQMIVGDLAPDRALACEARLSALGAPVERFTGPATVTIKKMRALIPDRSSLTLAYIDPYNLEYLSFEIIKVLADLKHVDLLVHFSTMDLTRNVDLELDDSRARFDDAAPGWRRHSVLTPKSQLPSQFFDYWRGLVINLGFSFSEAMPLVCNDANKPLYRLVFFSRHPLPNRVWADVAKGRNYELF